MTHQRARTLTEQGLITLARFGMRVGASAIKGGLEEVHKHVARGAAEAERRITRARNRLERIVEMPEERDEEEETDD